MSIEPSQMEFALERLKFTCAYEADHVPVISDDAQQLYKYALWLNAQPRDKDYAQIGRYYRLAYAAGHYRAGTNLHNLISRGLVPSVRPSQEVIDIVEQLISEGVPGGYYDMGHYLEQGYGVKQNTVKAHAYFRRAADLGNPAAQYYVSRLLAKFPQAKQVVLDMRRCAMNQGHAEAGFDYGIFLAIRDNYAEAVEGFQTGTRNGSSLSAYSLRNGFSTTDPKDRTYYLALPADPERVRRYKLIGTFLMHNEHLGAKVPDIDDIVPLPPAKLPEWDGTFAWLKEYENRQPAEKPSEAMIQALSREKGLDPETGLPLAPPQKCLHLMTRAAYCSSNFIPEKTAPRHLMPVS